MLEINITQYLFLYDRIYHDDGIKYPSLEIGMQLRIRDVQDV